MRVSVNLATRPFANLGPTLRRLRIAMGSLAVIVLGLWLGLHLLHGRADKVRAQERSLDVDISRLNQEQQGFRTLVAQPDNAAIIDRAGALNALIDQKSFSWTLAMEDLETVLPGGVQVTTLEPIVDKKDGHVAVHMRVVGPRDKAVELVANLEHSHRFLQPRIIGESAESTNSANPNQQLEPVSATNRENFDLLADYNPATAAEQEAAGHKRHAEHGAAEGPQPTKANPDEEMPAAHRAAPAARPARPAPSVRRQPVAGAPPTARPVIQDTPPIPPQAIRRGPQ
jgi:type IV pilus assembly protein PilN